MKQNKDLNNNFNDLISIVIPIYNVEKYLNKCIDSVINQTYKNLEIILVDDGSPDNCGNICEQYKKLDNRIKVIHKKNGGLSDARNFGIKVATGKYIGFVDSDDYISKDMYEKLFNLITENDADVSVVSYKEVNENYDISYVENDLGNSTVLSAEEAMRYLFNNKFGNFAWNKLYKLSLFNNVEYPIGKKMEDLGTTYKIFDKCSKVVYCDLELYYYLQRQNSILHTCDEKFVNDKFELSFDRYLFLKNNYPNIEENYKFIFENALRSYPILNYENKLKAEKVLNNKIINNITLSLFLRFLMYKFNKKLYSYIMIKRGV